MKGIILFMLELLLLAFHVGVQAQECSHWSSIGPSYIPGGTGRVICMAFEPLASDPDNPSTIYCGTPDGGLWKTTVGGNNWVPLTDWIPSLGVSGIVINPSNHNEIYILTGDGFPNTLVTAKTAGILKSEDGGSTWSTTGLGAGLFTAGRKLLMDPIDNSILFAITNTGIYRTVNSGIKWDPELDGDFNDCQFDPGDHTIMYACTNTQLWQSDKNGSQNSWTQDTSGLPSPSFFSPYNNNLNSRIAVSYNNNNYVYVLFDCGGRIDVYRSTNQGKDFGHRFQDSFWDLGSQTVNCTFKADPNKEDILYAGGGINPGGYLFKSTDGGNSWCTTPTSIVHSDFNAFEFSGSSIFAGTDGGIYKSTNGGNTFTDLTSGMVITQVAAIGGTPQNSNLYYFGAQDNGINKIFDNNNLVSQIHSGDGGKCFIDFTNPLKVYMQQGGYLFRTDDGGISIDTITPPEACHSYTMSPVSPSTLFAGNQPQNPTGNNCTIYKSIDRGDSWQPVLNAVGLQVSMAIAKSNPDYIYTAESMVLRKSTNGGQNWTDITGTLPHGTIPLNSIAVSTIDEKKMWVTCTNYSASRVFETTDSGSTWTNISGSLSNISVNCVAFEPGSTIDALYLGTENGVYYRDNILGKWIPFSTGLPRVIVTDFYINTDANKIVAATYGRGIWTSSLYHACDIKPEIVLLELKDDCGFLPPQEGSKVKFKFNLLKPSYFSAQTYTIKWGVVGGVPAPGETMKGQTFSIIAPSSTTQVTVTLDVSYQDGTVFSNSYNFFPASDLEVKIDLIGCALKKRMSFIPQHWQMGDPAEVQRLVQTIRDSMVLTEQYLNVCKRSIKLLNNRLRNK
jgi:photosystem II stability/assembly factor-like uncharacterized protein